MEYDLRKIENRIKPPTNKKKIRTKKTCDEI